MKNTETIAMLAKNTGVDAHVCQQIVTSFEEYGTHHLSKMKSAYIDSITEYIALDTNIAPEICKKVVTNLFEVLKIGLSNKLHFKK